MTYKIPSLFKVSLSTALLIVTVGCAGPTTPFGAVHSFAKPLKKSFMDARRRSENGYKPNSPKIYFYPKKQVLHSANDLIVQVFDPKGISPDYKISIFYNGYDVTNSVSLQRKDKIYKDKNQLIVTIPRLRILPQKDNDIQIVYARNRVATPVMSSFDKPSCNMYQRAKPRIETAFRVPASYVESINDLAGESKINASFFAGLIAQESSFDPNAVSSAKAIGLTQITKVAEDEIIKDFPNFPRHPKINAISLPYLKTLIMLGNINQKNEWRLDPEYSMQGGISYLRYLDNYWHKPQNLEMVKSVYVDTDQGLTDVIMASYNSGASRVKRALETKGYNWINDEELGEAKKYVGRVSSYCYHFAEKE